MQHPEGPHPNLAPVAIVEAPVVKVEAPAENIPIPVPVPNEVPIPPVVIVEVPAVKVEAPDVEMEEAEPQVYVDDPMDFDWEVHEHVQVKGDEGVDDEYAFFDEPMSFDSVRDDPMEWELANLLDQLDLEESPGHGYHLRPRRKWINDRC